MTYVEIKNVLQSLVESIFLYEDRDEIVKLSQTAGDFIKKSADLKQELCELYELEIHASLQDEETDDASSIDEESFAFYELSHQKIQSKNTKERKNPTLSQANSADDTPPPTNSTSTSHSQTYSIDSPRTSPQSKKGYLSKKNPLRNKWTDRYFVVEGGSELRWFESEELFLKSPKKPKGKIDLHKAKIHAGSQPSSHEGSPNPSSQISPPNFELATKLFIQSQGKNLTLDAKNESELQEWLEVLKAEEAKN